ncbi:MAG: DbpA RNA binding domain-containing protein, partial [Succinivibrionaceae bacterium]|nr:DbpA RNA binding domain-containing protein [Succinivibrionaceae bacterium]
RARRTPSAEPQPLRDFPDMKMLRYRLAVGHRDGVKPGQIVGAIANEGDIESKYIGSIDIFDSFTTIDLPEGMPPETLEILSRARVCGRALELREYTMEAPERGEGGGRFRDDDGERRFGGRFESRRRLDFDRDRGFRRDRDGRDGGFRGHDRFRSDSPRKSSWERRSGRREGF